MKVKLMKLSWTKTLITILVIAGIGLIGFAINNASSNREKEESICKDTSELRSLSDGPLKCHPKAKLDAYWGGGILPGQVFNICRCQNQQ